jgi:hypothetical protein
MHNWPERKLRRAPKELLLCENDCYVFEDAELLDRNASIMNIAGAGDYDNNIRQCTSRYIRFTLVIRPRDIKNHLERVNAETLPRTITQSVYLRVIKNNQNRMINAITRDIRENDMRQLLDIWKTQGGPFDGMMRSREGDPSTNTFKTWMDEVRAETTFEALAQVTAIEYIGKMEGLEGLESITLRLEKLQQIAYDPKTKSSVYLLHNKYTNSSKAV